MTLDAAQRRARVKTYRKKPVVIEAVQLNWANWGEVCDFLGGIISAANPGRNVDTYSDHCGEVAGPWIEITIPTLEGDHTAKHGDWVIKGVKGEFYPCKPDIFAATYEPAEPQAMTPDAAEKAGVPVVRGLVWATGENRWIALHPFGTEQIVRDHRASSATTHGWFNEGKWFWFGSLGAAQSAAQADYEQRILSALNPDFLSALDTARAEIERLQGEMLDWRNGDLAGVKAHMDAAISRAEKVESAFTAAQERIAELEGALEPFALISSKGVVPKGYEGLATITTSAEYFHRAARALSPKDPGASDE